MTPQTNSTFDGKILIVDDEPANVRLLEKILAKAGYSHLRGTTDSREVAALLFEFEPDVLLLDLQMPHVDGFDIVAQVHEFVPVGSFLPILVLTADITPQTKLRALSSGATDFLTKPFDQAEVVQRVGNLIHMRQLHQQVQAQKENLEQTVTERTAELEKALAQLKETQQQIIQQERLHAFGTMATGVAHDFNNALTTILGFGEVALGECEERPDRADLGQYLQTIITAAHDGAKMVNRLREFYRPADAKEPRVAIDLNELLKQAITITQPKWKSQALGVGLKIDIITELSAVPLICGDAAELREALTNLIFNAVDAMAVDGRITLRTHRQDRHVVIEVSDTGSGMSEEVRRRCLEPFFSTKGDRGTGLGLAMVYGIIERHQGTLDIQSTPGHGTTFIIALPMTEAVAGVEIVADKPTKVDRALHVLVVDDQPVLCALLTEYLKNDCHTVVTASNGRDALGKFTADNFDLVITDQAMPGLTGTQLAAAIKAHFPATPIILLTGFGEATEHGAEESIDCVLSKPVSVIDLRHALVRATNKSAGGFSKSKLVSTGEAMQPQKIEHVDLATM